MTESPEPGHSPTHEPASDAAVPHSLIERIGQHAVFKLDGTGRISSWPAPARQLYGYEAGDILGRPVTTLLATSKAERDESKRPVLTDLSPGETHRESEWHERADGAVFWGCLTVSQFGDDEADGYAVVAEDRTDQKEYERMLERQNDRLKEFTDIIAHDLRNPLNLIKGRLELYYDTNDSEHIEIIEETTDRMAALVDDLLTVARQGMVVEDPVATDLEEVTKTAWEGIDAPATASFRYDPIRLISTDPDRICELFENLFDNTVEHGGENVTVHVGPIEDGFYVEDDGPGIDSDIRDQVFDHGYSTSPEGHGYGLSIVRTIVNAHGWDIDITESDTGGARFEITGIEFVE